MFHPNLFFTILKLDDVHRDVTGFCLPELARTIFIDHTSAVVLLGDCTIDIMHRAKLCSVGCIRVCHDASVRKGYYVWQI